MGVAVEGDVCRGAADVESACVSNSLLERKRLIGSVSIRFVDESANRNGVRLIYGTFAGEFFKVCPFSGEFVVLGDPLLELLFRFYVRLLIDELFSVGLPCADGLLWGGVNFLRLECGGDGIKPDVYLAVACGRFEW